MYISKDTLFKIIYIALTIIHIVIYLIFFYKLHKIKSGKAFDLNSLKEKAIELAKLLINPNNSIISGIIEFIHNQAKLSDNDDDSDKTEDG